MFLLPVKFFFQYQINSTPQLLEKQYSVVLQMSILQDRNVIDNYLKTQKTNERGMWYNKDELVGKIGLVLRRFKEFAEEVSGVV